MTHSPHPFLRHQRNGFTLVELVVATSIFLVILGLFVTMVNSTSKIWQEGIAHNERRATALAVFGCLKRDLSIAAQPTDLSGSKLQMLIAAGTTGPLTSGSFTLPEAFFWQAPATTGTNGNDGDLAVVGYFVQWVKDSTAHTNTPKLCRLLINPSSAVYTVYSGTTSSSWISDALISGTEGAPATQASGYQGQLAENVLGLWVQPLDQKMQPITKNASGALFPAAQFDSTQGYTSTALYTSGTTTTTTPLVYPAASSLTGSSANEVMGSLPAAIQVAIVTIDSRTALRLSGTEKPGLPTGNLWQDVAVFYNSLPPLIKNGAEVQSTIINLASGPR
jgi:prepilin-type N-terminal cleavage/methylation domain-containing protein